MQNFKHWYSDLNIRSKLLTFTIFVILLLLVGVSFGIINLIIPFVQGYAVEVAQNRYNYLNSMLSENHQILSREAEKNSFF